MLAELCTILRDLFVWLAPFLALAPLALFIFFVFGAAIVLLAIRLVNLLLPALMFLEPCFALMLFLGEEAFKALRDKIRGMWRDTGLMSLKLSEKQLENGSADLIRKMADSSSISILPTTQEILGVSETDTPAMIERAYQRRSCLVRHYIDSAINDEEKRRHQRVLIALQCAYQELSGSA